MTNSNVGGAPVQVVFEQGDPKQVVLSLANTVLSTGTGGGGYPVLTMPTGFSVSGSGTALIDVVYSTGYSLPTTAKQSEWDSAFTDRFKWDGGSTGLNASTGRASLQLGGAAILSVGTGAGTVAAGDDARFSDARTPTAHKATHATGGSDALSPADIGAEVAGAASSAVTTHVGQADPHTQYALETSLATVATSGAYGDLSGRPTLGTAAALNVGTAAGNVVQLDGAGKLPAIDGSQLTNLPATGGAVTSVTGSAPVTSTGGTTPVIGISAATTSAPGSMSAADKTKLDGIAAGAEVNVNADWNASSGDAQILNKPTLGTAAAAATTDFATAAQGSKADTAVQSVTGTAPITSSGGTTPAIGISAATTSAAGSMSAADKLKLDGVQAGAQVNVGTDLSYTASSRLLASSTGADVTLPEATTSAAGLLSSTDKTKLDGVQAGAEVNVNADWNATSGDAQILNKPSIPAPADAVPLAPGTAAVGTSTEYAREDHVHPPPGLVTSTDPGLVPSAGSPGADGLFFWDDSAGVYTYATIGPGVVMDGTTLRAEENPWMALGDETTAATAGVKLTERYWPQAHRLIAIPLWSASAPVGSALQLDIQVGGTSIFSTLPTIAVGGTSSTTTTPAVFSTAFVSGGQTIAAGSVVTFHVTQAPSGGGGAGLKVQMPAVRA